MLLRSPQGEKPRWANRRLAAARTILSYVAEAGFLGFLYPSRTLAIVQKMVDRERAWSKSRQGIRCAPIKLRKFSSIASDSTDANGNTNGTPARAGSGLFRKVQGPAPKPDLGYYSEWMQVDSRLLELFESPKNGANYEKAWHLYDNLQTLTRQLTDQQRENMVRYLITGSTPLCSQRARHLVEQIPFSERDDFHQRSVFSIELNQLIFGAAMDYHRERLRQLICADGAALILRFTIEHFKLRKARRTLDDYLYELRRHQSEEISYEAMWSNIDRSSIWHHVRQLPFSILSRRAVAAVRFLSRTNPENASLAVAERLALELCIEAFSLQVDQPIDVKAHRMLFNAVGRLREGMTIQMFSSYNKAIRQLLDHNLEGCEELAIEYYRKLKKAITVPEGEVLSLLLQRFCAARDVTGIYEVIDDFRRHHGEIPLLWYRRVIPVLASQGEAEPVHELFKEYAERGGTHLASMFDSFLHVHNRRAEPHLVARYFDDLQRDYGFLPKLSSWNLVISTYARIGDVVGAESWFDRMVKAGNQPNVQTYRRLTRMYAVRGDIEDVQRLFRQSEAAGIKPDLSMIDSLVLALVKNDTLDDAEKLIEESLRINSDYPKTRMWNCILNAYAHRGDLVRVKDIHQRMYEAGVLADSSTHSALIFCLVRRRMPTTARTLLCFVLPRAKIPTNPVQYHMVISGFFERGENIRALHLYSHMLKRGRPAIQSIKIVLLKIIASLERQHLDQARLPKRNLVRTLDLFKQIITDMDPAELAQTHQSPNKGLNRLDEYFVSMNFSHLIFLYGKEHAFDKVRELYEQYLATAAKFQGTIDFIPPIHLLSALLSANAEARDYGEADRCWQFALEKAKKMAQQSDVVEGTPWRARYSRRFVLNQPLPLYMLSLESQEKIDLITTTMESLLSQGFEFKSTTWNVYVQILARNGREKLAFTVCEREMMDQWYGWESMGHKLDLRRRFRVIKPDGVRPTKHFPEYQTLVYLAAAYVKARLKDVDMVREIGKAAPRTTNAVANLPQLDDEFQSTILRSAASFEH